MNGKVTSTFKIQEHLNSQYTNSKYYCALRSFGFSSTAEMNIDTKVRLVDSSQIQCFGTQVYTQRVLGLIIRATF